MPFLCQRLALIEVRKAWIVIGKDRY